jgi:hypothetical protein
VRARESKARVAFRFVGWLLSAIVGLGCCTPLLYVQEYLERNGARGETCGEDTAEADELLAELDDEIKDVVRPTAQEDVGVRDRTCPCAGQQTCGGIRE